MSLHTNTWRISTSFFPSEPLQHTATFMLLDEQNITRQSVNTMLHEHQMQLGHILEVSSMDLLIQFAQVGLGIACVIKEFVKMILIKKYLWKRLWGLTFPIKGNRICMQERERKSEASDTTGRNERNSASLHKGSAKKSGFPRFTGPFRWEFLNFKKSCPIFPVFPSNFRFALHRVAQKNPGFPGFFLLSY